MDLAVACYIARRNAVKRVDAHGSHGVMNTALYTYVMSNERIILFCSLIQ
jgi:hypothetical protein